METDARLEEAVRALTRAVQAAASDLRLTTDELMQGLAFLTEVGRRDEFVLLSDVMGLSVLVDEITNEGSQTATASNVPGPFYVPGAPMLEPPFQLAPDEEPGEVLFLSGRVTDADTGASLPGAILDLWQANAEGLYSNQDPERLGEWHLRGRLRAGENGAYELRTIAPPPYEVPKDGPVGRLLRTLGRPAFRPAHLHLKAHADGYEPLTTMVFFQGDAWLDSDTIGAVKDRLVVRLERHEATQEGAARGLSRPFLSCTFDVALRPVLGGSSVRTPR
jgi:protocatechuate 3,4-dioxygenase beta subunit